MTTYKLIGEEPTEEMIRDGLNIDAAGIWKSMWKAAPEVKK